MTLSVTEYANGAIISEHGYKTEWNVKVETDQLQNIIDRLTEIYNRQVVDLPKNTPTI